MTSDDCATVLVVDDMPENIGLLASILEANQFQVAVATSGMSALEIIPNVMPDIILMDINMPGMDGFRTCEHIQAQPQYAQIPIIFVTGKTDVDNLQQAFDVGGVDYICKPIRAEEVLIRVNMHLKLRQLSTDLQYKNSELEAANKEITHSLQQLVATQKQLVQSEKMASLGQLVAGVAHEINTPLGVGITAASNLQSRINSLGQLILDNKIRKQDMDYFMSKSSELSQTISSNLQRAANLVSSFKLVAVDQSHEQKRWFDLGDYINDILISLQPQLKKTAHHIELICDHVIKLNSYPGRIAQVLTNLVMNSLTHAYDAGETGCLEIELMETKTHVRLEYRDDGKGIDPTIIQHIFDPFFTTNRHGGGTGLGLHIVYNIVVQTLKGHIQCEPRVAKGVKFILEFPK